MFQEQSHEDSVAHDAQGHGRNVSASQAVRSAVSQHRYSPPWAPAQVQVHNGSKLLVKYSLEI